MLVQTHCLITAETPVLPLLGTKHGDLNRPMSSAFNYANEADACLHNVAEMFGWLVDSIVVVSGRVVWLVHTNLSEWNAVLV